MIVGFAGKAGSGKDTCAHLGVTLFGGCIFSFAKPLKEICSIILNCSVSALDNREFKASEIPYQFRDCFGVNTYREVLQYVGTELFRNSVCDDFWIKVNHDRFQTAAKYNKNVFISDVRFQNEVDYIKSNGGHVIVLDRFSDIGSTHASEQSADLQGVIHIDNRDGIKSKLEKTVVDYLYQFRTNK